MCARIQSEHPKLTKKFNTMKLNWVKKFIVLHNRLCVMLNLIQKKIIRMFISIHQIHMSRSDLIRIKIMTISYVIYAWMTMMKRVMK